MQKRDVIAGLSVAGLMLPEAVAYAGIAGVPPQRAILAAIAGSLVYAVAGRSRFAIISPTSSSAALLAAALLVLPGDQAAHMALVTIMVVLVGLMFVAASIARLGGLAGFVSRPVLRGFAFGLAITIIVKQLPTIAGVAIEAPDLFHLAAGLIGSLGGWHWASAATGLAALAALLLLRRRPMLPGAFIVLAGGIAASLLFDLPAHGVATVGMIDVRPVWPAAVLPSWQTVSELAQLTVPLVLILFAESWGTIRGMALRHGDSVDPDRELRALGCANLASAVVQGMPVGAGFSAGAAAEAAGTGTRMTGVIAAFGLGLLMLAGAGLVAHLPEPVLAAVVIAALTHALDPQPLARLWRLDRDQYIGAAAALGVLLFGVLDGMLLAIALSLAAMVRRLAAPHITRLARLGDGHDYVDAARHPEAALPAGIAVWRPDEPLFFGNAERVLAAVAARQAADPSVHVLVLSLENSFDLDSTALDVLREFDVHMASRQVSVRLARVRDQVRDLLVAAHADDLAARSNYSVDDAVRSAQEGTR